MDSKQKRLISALENGFPNDQIEVVDYAGDDDHFTLKVTSAQFAGMKTIEKQRLIFKVLGPELLRDVHAMQLELKTPGN